ncbi:RNA polymerase sigma factor [Mariniluteicoccus endophyticus]
MRSPFDAAVAEHGATVLRVCRAMLGPVDADDAWSDTFLKALRAWPELADDANVEAWLVTIARRACLDSLRRRTPVPVDRTPDGPSTLGNPAPPEPVWQAVAGLPPRQRDVLVLKYAAGLPYAEIAARLGGTPEAARRAASDALRALRAQKESL